MKIFRSVLVLLLLVCSSMPLCGQEAGDLEEVVQAEWTISFTVDGNATTTLSTEPLFAAAPDAKRDDTAVKAALTGALQAALRCTPQDVHFAASSDGYWLSASCQIPVVKRGLGIEGEFLPNPMLRELRKLGIAEIEITIDAPRLGYSHGLQQVERYQGYGSVMQSVIFVGTEEQSIPDIRFELGYRGVDLIWKLAPLALILVAPLLLTLWLRKRSLVLAKQDATAAWYGYFRVHSWMAEGMWLVWAVALVALDVDKLLRFVTNLDSSIPYLAMLFVPAGCVSLFCQYLARPVWLHVRGIEISGREMLIRGFWQQTTAVLPLLFFILGLTYLVDDAGKGMLFFALAVVALLATCTINNRVSGSTPRTLHGGELKERVLELAQRAGVRIKSVLVMPATPFKMGNAFAMSGGNVMITDYLLERLTKTEADCVMAHEVGHVKYRHTLLLSFPGFLVIYIAINLLLKFAVNLFPDLLVSTITDDIDYALHVVSWLENYLIYPAALLLASLTRYFISRRFERSADEFAALLTGSPEAMITALVKLSRMNLMPLHWGSWDERLATHPSTLRRVDAIAQRHRIGKNRLQELLDAQPRVEGEEAYPLPEEVASSSLVFSAEYRTARTTLTGLLLLFATAAAPLLTAHLIDAAGLPWYAHLAGLVVAPAGYLLVCNYFMLAYRDARRTMQEKVAAGGVELAGKEAFYVGVAPEGNPRTYDGQRMWDVGFLVIGDNALHYHGDKISFTLPRAQVTTVSKGVQYPMWFPMPETYIRWKSGETERVFHLHSMDGASLISCGRISKELLIRLIKWHEEKVPAQKASSQENSLPLPEFPEVSGVHPRAVSTAKGIFTALGFLALLVFGLAWVFRLPDSVTWIGFAMSAWCVFFSDFPIRRYKEVNLSAVHLPPMRSASRPPSEEFAVNSPMPSPHPVSVSITCPSCGLTKEVPEERIPGGSVVVTCPKCSDQFQFLRELSPQPA